MDLRYTKEQKEDIEEHYAYKSSNKCVKYDEIKAMVGGVYDSHPVIGAKIALHIFSKFTKLTRKVEGNLHPEIKVENIASFECDEECKKYRIFIFGRPRTATNRRQTWLKAGFFMSLGNKLGYTRIFSFPCKLQLMTKYYSSYDKSLSLY